MIAGDDNKGNAGDERGQMGQKFGRILDLDSESRAGLNPMAGFRRLKCWVSRQDAASIRFV
jgi:hypothetical protein